MKLRNRRRLLLLPPAEQFGALEHVDSNRKDDNQANNDVLPVGIDLCQHHRVDQHAVIAVPMSVPRIVPDPPIKLVPPMMTAAITVSSQPLPCPGWSVLMRDVRRIPPMALNRPLNIVHGEFHTFHVMPDRRAVSSLPPTAYTLRPYVVWLSTRCAMTARASMDVERYRQARKLPWPSVRNPAGRG